VCNNKPSFFSCCNPNRRVLIISGFIPRHINTYYCICFSLSNEGTKFTEIHSIFKSSLRICCYVPYKRSHLPLISKMLLCQSLLTILWFLFMFLPLQDVEERPEHSQSSTEGAPCFNWDNHSESVLLTMALLPKVFQSLHTFLM
jgi:hypothetical protein